MRKSYKEQGLILRYFAPQSPQRVEPIAFSLSSMRGMLCQAFLKVRHPADFILLNKEQSTLLYSQDCIKVMDTQHRNQLEEVIIVISAHPEMSPATINGELKDNWQKYH